MRIARSLLVAILVEVAMASAQGQTVEATAPQQQDDWRTVLSERAKLFGHRNWIAVVDSAYPAQTSAGVETVVTDANHLDVMKTVLDALGKSPHVRPVIYVDAELEHVSPEDAPGIDKYRAELEAVLAGRPAKAMPHGEVIDRLDAAGTKFRVLILKSTLALPYTSVFIELDCGYWSPEAEQRLRARISASGR